MATKVKALSFDCYGALIDWQAGVRAFVAARLARPSPSTVARPPVDEWLARWHQIRGQMREPYRPWRELVATSCAATMKWFGLEAFADDGPLMVRHIAGLEPRPEAPAVLRQLGRGHRLALVANPDRDALAEAMGRLQAPFSSVVTAEDVCAYKPDPKLFELMLERLRLPPNEVLHIATSAEEDAAPARAVGMRTALVAADGEADLHFSSLAELGSAV
jgi:2-haloacid dehalogenase